MPDPLPTWLTTLARQVAAALPAAARKRAPDHWIIIAEMVWYAEWHPLSRSSTYREEESHEEVLLTRNGDLLLRSYTVKRSPPSPEYRQHEQTRPLNGVDLARFDFERRQQRFKTTEPRLHRQEGFSLRPTTKRLHPRLGDGLRHMLTDFHNCNLNT